MNRILHACRIAAFAFLLAADAPLHAAQSPADSPKPPAQKARVSQLDVFAATADLGLSEEQQAKGKAVEAEYNRQSKLVMENPSSSREEKKAKMQDLRTSALNEIKTILTAPQKQRYEQALSRASSASK